MNRLILPVLLFCLFHSDANAQKDNDLRKQLHTGDILLQAIPCGGLCDAIIETTPCAPGKPYNHCGLVRKDASGTITVIEAIGKAVKETPLDTFLKREQSNVLAVARTKGLDNNTKDRIIEAAARYIGTPYDDVFVPGDTALYCSELVYEAYQQSGNHIFRLSPMTFKSPKTNTTYPAWEAYYKDMNYTIPEGLPGINPCAIAVNPAVEVLYLNRGKN